MSPSVRAVHLYRLASQPGGVCRTRIAADFRVNERGLRRLIAMLRKVPGIVVDSHPERVVVREAVQ